MTIAVINKGDTIVLMATEEGGLTSEPGTIEINAHKLPELILQLTEVQRDRIGKW